MQDKYKEVIDILSAKKPVLSQKGALVNRVMQNLTMHSAKISLTEKAGHYLFAWVYVGWVRKVMATAAILFFGFFVFQQLTLNNRVTRLENRIVKSSLAPPDFRKRPDLKQRLFFELVSRNLGRQDSITLSKKELNDLLQSYSNLQERYEKMKKHVKEDSYIDRILKKNFDNRQGKEQGDLNL